MQYKEKRNSGCSFAIIRERSYYYVQWKWNNIHNQGLARCQYHVTFKTDNTIRNHREYRIYKPNKHSGSLVYKMKDLLHPSIFHIPMLQRAHPKIKYNKKPSNYASHIMNTVHKDRNIHSTMEIRETKNKGACINKSGKYNVNCTKKSKRKINQIIR